MYGLDTLTRLPSPQADTDTFARISGTAIDTANATDKGGLEKGVEGAMDVVTDTLADGIKDLNSTIEEIQAQFKDGLDEVNAGRRLLLLTLFSVFVLFLCGALV